MAVSPGNWARVLWIGCVIAWVGFFAWLDASGEGRRTWVKSQAVLALAGVIVGFIVLSWQLQRQHANTLKANRRSSQDRLKVELYNRIADRIEATRGPLTDISLLPTAFVGELGVRLLVSLSGGRASASEYFPRLAEPQRAAADTVIALMSVLETHEIVMPLFGVFRDRLAEALQDLNRALFEFTETARPFAGLNELPSQPWPPTDDQKLGLQQLADSLQRDGFSLVGVVADLRCEAQNALLGNLFPGQRAARRVPGDQPVRVTTVPAGDESARKPRLTRRGLTSG